MCSICMVHEGDAAHLHVTTINTNKLTQYTKNTYNNEEIQSHNHN